ncbi:hypothetical protein QWI17_13645 [Gilvimarinus sp. SDUM040013]|uniref:DUF2232 domain-containing protein n=1 Tax=Gilvimarinus gilvus TaxID=3058038 RepID=A0ABU4S2Q8_9GAMM|nr:hypothetical protein [Gilvimarinus sp. SDUM040013]MDO3386885.1 hypothetical protein [Gilvimarinus sp. SDUM040013]MDX6851459.1 hypothetical protein [Gilvimarinus sp. SDUM040013]
MRALAQFVMRGRTQAAAVALVGHWIPLVSPAAVALVTLRRGMADGLLVLLWALLPPIVYMVVGQTSAVLAVIGAISVFAIALLLRSSASWAHALMGLVACNTLGVLLLAKLAPGFINEMIELGKALFDSVRSQASQPVALPEADTTLVLGWLAALGTLSCILSMLLGRWWQAQLYNPGGFGEEFRALRLKPVAAMVCLVAALYCYLQPGSMSVWVWVFVQPLLFAGIALVHSVAKRRALATQWMVLFYCALLLVQPLKILLVVIAFCDTWLNIRGKIRAKP